MSDSNTYISKAPYVAPGMPPLEPSGKAVSFFEFWPTWLMYMPVVMQWLFLSIRYRSLTLPLIANPTLPLSGMVGVPKSIVLEQSESACQGAVLPFFVFVRTHLDENAELSNLLVECEERGFKLPLVCKPDIGCRGAGVKLIKSSQELKECLASYPMGASMMVQKLASYEPEAGVFYIRNPDEANGRIVSLALKYSPYVVGDGHSTLRTLIEKDSRASQLMHLYESRHADVLNKVLALNEPFKLVFSASHCRGAIFRDARHLITPKLTQELNRILSDLNEFHYGRLDVKFPDIEKLQKGEGIEIVEINTASSESLHIWDRNATLKEAVRSLLFQYRTLFQLGHQNRKRGHKTPGVLKLLKHWKIERELTASYPETD